MDSTASTVPPLGNKLLGSLTGMSERDVSREPVSAAKLLKYNDKAKTMRRGMALASVWSKARLMALTTTLLCGSALEAGCLYTGPIETAEEANLTPSVGLCCTQPAMDLPVIIEIPLDADPPLTSFGVDEITDPNLTDDLAVRWFIDGGDAIVAFQNIPGLGNELPIRDTLGAVAFEASVDDFSNRVGTHRVEAIVADRDGFEFNDGSDNRAIAMGANALYLYWQIEFREF